MIQFYSSKPGKYGPMVEEFTLKIQNLIREQRTFVCSAKSWHKISLFIYANLRHFYLYFLLTHCLPTALHFYIKYILTLFCLLSFIFHTLSIASLCNLNRNHDHISMCKTDYDRNWLNNCVELFQHF